MHLQTLSAAADEVPEVVQHVDHEELRVREGLLSGDRVVHLEERVRIRLENGLDEFQTLLPSVSFYLMLNLIS